jgi:uncharacterized damage-inducible protein DinB
MVSSSTLEYWLRGPLPGIPGLLQPPAHALLQARDEVNNCLVNFPEDKMWMQPAGSASVAFHLQHLAGVLDRLFTYAKGEQLDQQQLNYLAAEGKENTALHLHDLLLHFNQQTDKAIEQLKNTAADSLTDIRFVGRKQIPSTVSGLLFHAAEHTMRHNGQLLVTVKFLRSFT